MIFILCPQSMKGRGCLYSRRSIVRRNYGLVSLSLR
ncbi:unnamed protein product [Brassica oleracea var. botrytis]|uniref:Uncharacterized protein n=1 Tax=Brassica oleracea TaxID=3712 RepID=A0A3P6GBE3_BRAOL|nr:unnamed protein product [Brassica oleracea]